MLTVEEKKAMIDYRIKVYESKIFELQMDQVAALANEESAAAEQIGKTIGGLEKAIAAVQDLSAMRGTADA